ncbi:MAG: transposase, partial [Thiobacillus sp.]
SARKIASRYREPWLLSCSPGLSHLSAEAIVRLYAQRMRIEEEFRDTKNIVLGAGLALSRSHGQPRLQALLLIGHIAHMAKRLIGEAAKSAQLHLQLMSTNRKDRAELSVMMLAKRVIDSPTLLRKLKSAWPSWHVLRSQVSSAINRAMAV